MPDNNVANYKEQGGARDVIGGSLDILSGGEVDFESGSTLKFAGTTITLSATQLNRSEVTTAGVVEASKVIVAGASKNLDVLDLADLLIDSVTVTASAAQLNRTAVTTTGVVEASKVVVVDANKKVDTLDITTPLIGGTTITATADQLNRAAVTTAGTVEASKAVVVGASKDVDHLRVEELMLGAVTVTVTGTTLNLMVQAATAGIAVTGGQLAFTGSTAIDTGLATVNSFAASQVSDPSVTVGLYVTAIPGSTAGYIEIKSWRPTAAGDNEPAAGAESVTASWVAVGPV